MALSERHTWGTGLDERTGQLRLDPGAQIRRNVVAQHRQRSAAQFLNPEVDGGIPDPLDDHGGPGGDLCAAGSLTFAGRQLAGVQVPSYAAGEVFRPGEAEQQFAAVGVDLAGRCHLPLPASR